MIIAGLEKFSSLVVTDEQVNTSSKYFYFFNIIKMNIQEQSHVYQQKLRNVCNKYHKLHSDVNHHSDTFFS